MSSPSSPSTKSSDVVVMGTSDDAALSKLSCVHLGYFQDPYLALLIASASHTKARRPPLINRGYWTRVSAIRQLLQHFLLAPPSSLSVASDTSSNASNLQIVSLGAGADTTYFRLASETLDSSSSFHLLNRNERVCLIDRVHRYVEIDFVSTMETKAALIEDRAELKRLVGKRVENGDDQKEPLPLDQLKMNAIEIEKGRTHSSKKSRPAATVVHKYERLSLVGVDMRQFDAFEEVLEQAGLDFTLPTFFLSECVLIYMRPEESRRIIEWSARKFTGGSAFVSYEQIEPFDAFGATMIANLEQRGCPLLGYTEYPTIADQRRRYLDCGYEHYEGLDMNGIYRYALDREEIKRIEKLELFDEFEEWFLIQGHYHVSLATKGEHPSVQLKLRKTVEKSDDASSSFSAKLQK